MDIPSLGRLIAQNRKIKGLTIKDLAQQADMGRSTLAALEGGRLTEIGWGKISRLCRALNLVVEIRPPVLQAPLLAHRHVTELAGRELTKAAIDEVISRGDLRTWSRLVEAIRHDQTGRLARRTREVAGQLAKNDSKARAFAKLLPELLR